MTDFTKLFEYLNPIIVFGLLGFAISQTRRVTNDIMNHLTKIGETSTYKDKVAFSLIVYFYSFLLLCLLLGAVYLNI